MKSRVFILVVFAGVVAAFGQAPPQPAAPVESTQPYQPAVPPPSISGYGGYGYSGGASTVAGSHMRGMGDVISAKGNYNLSTSAAAVNLTHARQQQIQNHAAATNTYFEMRQANR